MARSPQVNRLFEKTIDTKSQKRSHDSVMEKCFDCWN